MASSKVIFNVGGEQYTTSVGTLTAHEKNGFFTELFARDWQSERDPKDDRIFIDRNRKLFSHIVEYLRTGAVPNTVNNDESLRQNLVVEADYFRLQNFQNILTKPTFPGNTFLESYQHKKKLNEFYGQHDQQWELIYRASRDGYEEKHFHAIQSLFFNQLRNFFLVVTQRSDGLPQFPLKVMLMRSCLL
jgi:hypothetical protein